MIIYSTEKYISSYIDQSFQNNFVYIKSIKKGHGYVNGGYDQSVKVDREGYPVQVLLFRYGSESAGLKPVLSYTKNSYIVSYIIFQEKKYRLLDLTLFCQPFGASISCTLIRLNLQLTKIMPPPNTPILPHPLPSYWMNESTNK